MLTSLSTETGLFYPRKSTVSDLTSSNASSPRVPVLQCRIDLSYSCPPSLLHHPPLSSSLTGKSHLEIPQGTQMSWGLLRPTLRGRRLSAGTTRGDPISVPRASWTKKVQSPGPAGPRKAQPLPFWWPTCHNYSHSACHSLGCELTPQSGGSEEAPNHRTARVHRWSQSGRDTTWRRLGQGVSGKYQRAWQEQLSRLSLFRRHFLNVWLRAHLHETH